MTTTPALIESAKAEVAAHFAHLEAQYDDRILAKAMIANYTAAMAVNFTDWIGKSLSRVKSPEATFALHDNLDCEQVQNHVGMLEGFAAACNAEPEKVNDRWVAQELNAIRLLLSNLKTAGLTGLTILALLEAISELFIPRLEKWALMLGARDLEYTKCHGAADMEHSAALIKGLDVERQMEYYEAFDADVIVSNATIATLNLLRRVFTYPNSLPS